MLLGYSFEPRPDSRAINTSKSTVTNHLVAPDLLVVDLDQYNNNL